MTYPGIKNRRLEVPKSQEKAQGTEGYKQHGRRLQSSEKIEKDEINVDQPSGSAGEKKDIPHPPKPVPIHEGITHEAIETSILPLIHQADSELVANEG